MLACGGGAIRAVERGRPLAAARLPSGPQVFLSPMHQSMKHFVICGDNEGKLHYVALDRCLNINLQNIFKNTIHVNILQRAWKCGHK